MSRDSTRPEAAAPSAGGAAGTPLRDGVATGDGSGERTPGTPSSVLLRARRRLLGLDDVPAFPEDERAVLELVMQPDVSLTALATAIDRNPGLAANVVGLANSAYYASGREVYCARDAIVRVLGLRTVRSLTLSLLLSSSFDVSRCPAFDLVDHWARSLGTAILARRLGETTGDGDPDEAYLCGLLHDFGTLLLVHVYPDEMGELLGAGSGDRALFRARQVRRIGLDAGRAGAILCRRWSLPASVGLVAEHYWDAAWDGPCADLARHVGVASQRVDRLLAAVPDDRIQDLVARCGGPSTATSAVLQDFQDEIEDVTALARQLRTG